MSKVTARTKPIKKTAKQRRRSTTKPAGIPPKLKSAELTGAMLEHLLRELDRLSEGCRKLKSELELFADINQPDMPFSVMLQTADGKPGEFVYEARTLDEAQMWVDEWNKLPRAEETAVVCRNTEGGEA